MIGSILTSLGLILAGYIYVKVIRHKPPPSLKGKHVIITGGSKGIGRAMAFEAVKLGANVTIVARDMDVLEKVKIELLKIVANPATQKIAAFSVDVSASSAASSMEQVVAESEEDLGPVYMLINCAGTSISGTFEDTKIEEFHRMMNINLMGSVMCTKAVVSSMKKRNEGVIIFVSSIAGLLGLYGYSAYSASKFAVVGLAEVLAMELRPYNIKVSVSFPPDTDTPGFEEEQKGKPRETQLISESGGLYQPNVVAQTTLADALVREDYLVSFPLLNDNDYLHFPLKY